MELNIKATMEERGALAKAIDRLNNISHIKSMSLAMLGTESGVKPSKVRIGLQDMLDDGEIEQLEVGLSSKVRRYYYILTDKGREAYAAHLEKKI